MSCGPALPAGSLGTAVDSPEIKRVKIVHIINSLGIGGAELVLYRLLTHCDRRTCDMQVVALIHEDPLGDRLREAGIRVHCLHMSKRTWSPTTTISLIRFLRIEKPDVVQTWLQQSDLLGGIAARLAGVRFVFWNVRHSTLHPTLSSRRTRIVSRLCALLSNRIPTRILCCSESSRDEQLKLGYAISKMTVIPNGIDTDRFKPDRQAYSSLRRDLGVPPGVVFIGAAGRFHPAKDHAGLIRAAAEIAKARHDVHFVFCGDQVSMQNQELEKQVVATGFANRFHLLGQRDDVPRILAALDIFISSSSFSEGFPNVICEAMACGVPCVVTDVGDSARIVAETGRVIPPAQPCALAEAALQLCAAGPECLQKLGGQARRRISEHFGMWHMVARYQAVYAETIADTR